MSDPVVDVLARVQKVNLRIGGLLVELLNHDDPATQAAQLHDLGLYLDNLSASASLGRSRRTARAWSNPRGS